LWECDANQVFFFIWPKHEIVGNKIRSGTHFYIRKTNWSCVSGISDRIFACQNENTYKTMTGTYL
jgi:hypothetical protein